MSSKTKVGRPKLMSRNWLVCLLRIEHKMKLKEIADYLGITESRVSRILEKNLANFYRGLDKITPFDRIALLNELKSRAASAKERENK